MSLLSTSTRFADLLTALAGWLLVACGGWLALLCAAALIEAATSGRLRAMSWVGCPPGWRRALFAGLGAVLATASGPVAVSASSREPGEFSGVLPAPARTLGAAAPTTHLVVRRGDTLWDLAGGRMSSRASAAEVCHAVERLHRRNLGVIGPDPDLLLPGQRLVVPPPHLR